MVTVAVMRQVLKWKLHKQNYPKSLASKKNLLVLKPDQPGKHVLTSFWWDNFGCKKENLHESIHTTHGIAFQEKSEHSTSVRNVNSITLSGQKIVNVKTCNLPLVQIDPKSSLPKFPCDVVIQNEKREGHFQHILALLTLERRIHSGENQIIPTFAAPIMLLFAIETFQTVLIFLPPIPYRITEFSTVCETIHRSIHLSKILNLKYTHVTVVVGAAEKHYRVIWNNPVEFKGAIIIHPGELHVFMQLF